MPGVRKVLGEGRSLRPLWGGRIEVNSRQDHQRAAAGLAELLMYSLGARALSRLGQARAVQAVERHAARALLRRLAATLDMDGLHHARAGGPYVVAALHEGFLDVPLLLHLPLDLTFVARDELFGWPVLGQHLRECGHIAVSPERGASGYRRLLTAARERARRGSSIALFPQGSILGVETALNPGAIALARTLELPLLPVAITGTHRAWEHPFTPRLRYGERLSLRVLEPLTTEELTEGSLESLRLDLSRRLKEAALSGDMAPPRRYRPERDGYWDRYAFEIDPFFPEVARAIAERRQEVEVRAA